MGIIGYMSKVRVHNEGKKQLNITRKEVKYLYELVVKDGTNKELENRLLMKLIEK